MAKSVGRPHKFSEELTLEILYLREKIGLSFRDIARQLRIKDHTTVFRAYKSLKPSENPAAIKKLQQQNRKLGLQTPPPQKPPVVKVEPQIPVKPKPTPKPQEEAAEVVETKEPLLVETEDAEDFTCLPATKSNSETTYLAPHDHYDTVPRNVKLTDDQLADKINMLVPKLLGMTEGEAALAIEEMTGAQRVSAAANLVEKMRLLRNQSTENVSTNNFVTLISKLTAQIRLKDNGKKE